MPAFGHGHEFLGAAKYESFAINNLPSGRHGKTFSKEFGPSQNVLIKWAEQRTHPIVATQGLWRGGAHDYSGSNILTEGLKELEKFAKIASNHQYQQFQFSIFCEHTLSLEYMEKVFKEQWKIVRNSHNLQLVNTPMQGGALLPKDFLDLPKDRFINEIHGVWNPSMAGKAPYMWAGDGLPAQDCNIQLYKDRHQAALVLWLWMQQYNCKAKLDETTPINQRKVKPVGKQVVSLEYLIPPKGTVKLVGTGLIKSHSDQHGAEPVGREQKPVGIFKESGDKIQFVAANGKVVAEAPRQGNFTDGRPMYRCPIWGFEVQDKAVAIAKSPIVKVVLVKGSRKTNLGTINPAFRENAWRDKAELRKLRISFTGIQETWREIDKVDPDWV